MYINNINSLLEDADIYKPQEMSQSKQIENQANKVIKSSFKNIFGKCDLERSYTGSEQLSLFITFIKDHKQHHTANIQ